MFPSVVISGRSKYPVFTGKSFVIDGEANNLQLQQQNYGLYSYHTYYQNGRTYKATRQNHVSSNGRAGIIEYYNGEVNLQIFNQNPTGIDYHDEVTFQIDSTGIITVVHGQHAGTGDYNDVWKMGTPYDITSFTKQTNSPNDSGNYPKFYRATDNSYFLIGRVITKLSSPTEWDLYFTTYNGSTWGTPIKFFDIDAEDSKQVTTYLTGINEGTGEHNDKLYIRWMKRVDVDPVVLYRDRYIAYCLRSDINTWYNLAGTFSKNISTEGAITETEANTNYRYAVNTDNNGVRISSTVSGNNVYLVESIDDDIVLNKFENGSWSSTQSVDDSNINLQQFWKDGNYFFSITKDLDNNVCLYVSLDAISWTKKRVLYSHPNSIFLVHIPHNMSEIPKGQKFAVFCDTREFTGSVVDSPDSNSIVVLEMIK